MVTLGTTTHDLRQTAWNAAAQVVDPEIPVLSGFPLNEDPLAPISNGAKSHVAANGDRTEIEFSDVQYQKQVTAEDRSIFTAVKQK